MVGDRTERVVPRGGPEHAISSLYNGLADDGRVGPGDRSGRVRYPAGFWAEFMPLLTRDSLHGRRRCNLLQW